MRSINHVLRDPSGLHARIAAAIVAEAQRWESDVTLISRGVRSDASDVMGLMLLDVREGDIVAFEVEGADEDEAAAALEQLVEGM